MGFKPSTNKTQLADLTNKIVYSGELTEAASAISITTDNNGDSFSLKTAELSIIVPAGADVAVGTSATITGQVNGIVSGYFSSFNSSENFANFFVGAVRNVLGVIDTHLKCSNSALQVETHYYYSDGTTRSDADFTGGRLTGVEAITEIQLSFSADFPSGTKFQLRGQRE